MLPSQPSFRYAWRFFYMKDSSLRLGTRRKRRRTRTTGPFFKKGPYKQRKKRDRQTVLVKVWNMCVVYLELSVCCSSFDWMAGWLALSTCRILPWYLVAASAAASIRYFNKRRMGKRWMKFWHTYTHTVKSRKKKKRSICKISCLSAVAAGKE